MKKSRWVFGLAGLLVILTVLVAACSQPAPAPTTQAPKPTTSAPAPAPTSTPTATSTPTTSAPAPAQVFKIKSVGFSPVGDSYDQTMVYLNQKLKDLSGGRIVADYYPAGQLFDLTTGFDALRKNTIQLGQLAPNYFPEQFGAASVVQNIPYSRDYATFVQHWADAGGFKDWLSPYYEKLGLKFLFPTEVSYFGLATRSKFLITPDDFKGRLIKSSKGGVDEWVKNMGAEPTFVSMSELVAAVEKGTIDGAIQSIISVNSNKLQEKCPYVVINGLQVAGTDIIVSQAFYNSLPADLKKVVDDASKATFDYYVKSIMEKSVNKAIDEIKATKGAQVHFLTPAEEAVWKEKAKPSYDAAALKFGDEWQRFMKVRETIIKK